MNDVKNAIMKVPELGAQKVCLWYKSIAQEGPIFSFGLESIFRFLVAHIR